MEWMETAAVRFISGSTDSGKRSNMQTDNRFLDDLAKVASGALGSVSGVKHEVEVRIQQQLERLLARMNLVPREEFDAMKAVAQAAREAQIRLEARVAALEARLAAEDAIAAANLADAPEANAAAQESESDRP
jgi:BMFP domain-containing protein YqiC